jgi:hypothetical protein
MNSPAAKQLNDDNLTAAVSLESSKIAENLPGLGFSGTYKPFTIYGNGEYYIKINHSISCKAAVKRW